MERKKARIIDRISNILTRPKVWIEERELLGARFGVITAQTRDGVPDWAEITELAGRFADRMLLPDGIAPPHDSPIRALECPRHEKRVLLATACAIIDGTRMPMYRRMLGLIDPTADHSDMLYALLKHYTSVRVVTEATDHYSAAAEDMMERLGAPVLVGGSLSALAGCVLALAPGAMPAPDEGRVPCPVLVGAGFDPARCREPITDLQVETSPALREQCPSGISPHRLAAALYEYCGVDTGVYTADRMVHNYRQATVSQVIQAVMQNAGTAGLV